MLIARPRSRKVQWNALPDELQLELAGQALVRAAETLAGQAECLADEMEGVVSRRRASVMLYER